MTEKPTTTNENYNMGRVVLLAVVAALGGFLFGYDTAVINGAVGAMSEALGLSSALKGFTVSSALLGCVLGAWAAGRIAATRGRIPVMVAAAVLFVISAIGSGLAFTVWDMILWRMIGGIGVGAASVIAPAYIAEIAPPAIRGRLGSLQQMAIVIGIFVSLLVDAWLAGTAGSASNDLWGGMPAWRWMFLAEVVPAVLYGVMALQIPESPRFLVAAGRLDRAKEVLASVQTAGVDYRIEEIHKTVAREAKASMVDLRAAKGYFLPIVWVGIALSVFQQFVGINVIFYYSSVLWQSVGFTESDALTQTVITSVTNIVVTILAIALIDKIGRRKLLMIGSGGMTLTLGTMAFIFSQAPIVDGSPELGDAAGRVALVAANLFVVFFGMSWGPGVWVLLGEMFNNRIRSTALGVAAAAQWIANFAISTTFPSMADVGLWFAYGFYTLAAAASLVFVLRFVPETTGKTLEDM